MRINKITGTSFNNKIVINTNKNKHVEYLYNKVVDLAREDRVPAIFHLDRIELPYVKDNFLTKLNNLKIYFNNLEK